MPKKIECPKCHNETFLLPHCTKCGARLIEEDDNFEKRLIDQAQGEVKEEEFVQKYRNMHKALNLQQDRFGRVMAFRQLPGTPFMGIRKVLVPQGWKGLVYAEAGALAVELVPGVYPVSKQHIHANKLAGFLDSFTGTSLSVFLVRSGDFPVTFIVPEAEGPYSQLSVCNIRSSEGFIGGAAVTAHLRVTESLKLLLMLRGAENVKLDTPGLLRVLGAPLEFIGTLLHPPYGDSNLSETEITAQDLWMRVRAEFVQALQSAVLDESVQEMRSSVEVRNRILSKVSNAMAWTMQKYGIEIAQVTAFQFLCPEHDMILRTQSDTALAQAELESEKTMAAIRQGKRDLSKEDAIGTVETERKIEQVTLEKDAAVQQTRIKTDEEVALDQAASDGRVGTVRHVVRADEERHLRERDVAQQEHQRDQEWKNRDQSRRIRQAEEEIDISLQLKKAKGVLELREQFLEGEHRRRLATIKAIQEAGLAPESILAVFLTDRPELASAYADAVRARSYEERLALQKGFEDKLTGLATKDRENITNLLQEGIKQMGAVMVEAQRKQRPQVVVPSAIVPQQLPPSGGTSVPSDEKPS